MRALKIMIHIMTIIAFVVFIFHGGIFLIVPLMLVHQLIFGRKRRFRARVQYQRQSARPEFNPNRPYDNL